MKQKIKIWILPVLLIVGLIAQAAGVKVKFKDGNVLVNGKPFLLIKKDPIDKYDKIFSNLQNIELLIAKLETYDDPKEINESNKDGTVVYYEILDAKTYDLLFEVETRKDLVRILYNTKALGKDNLISKEKLDMLSKRIGKPYTRKRKELCK